MPRPNILWICTDQQRFDSIRAFGNQLVNTPNLDRLVSEGVAFTNAFCQAPVCTPSRASFLTGRYPRTTRTRQNGQCIPEDEVLVTKMLADEGYDCGLSGKLHLSACCRRVEQRIDDGYRQFYWSHHPNPDWPENQYIHWLEAKGYKWEDLYEGAKGRHVFPGVPGELHQTKWCIDKAMDFINEEREGPWCMSVNIFDPHHPFDPPQEYLDRYDPDKLPDPKYKPGELDNKPFFQRIDHDGAYGGRGMAFSKMTPRERREVTAACYAMVELIDHNVGRILDFLDEKGLRENTIMIFHSDHGELQGDHGMYWKGPFMYDCSTRVPLIISWPGHFKQGLTCDALVELVDIVPTLLTAAGMPIPTRVQGRSFYDICTGEADPHNFRDSVLTEFYIAQPFHKKYDPQAYCTMVRTRTHKLVAFHGMDEGELYDLRADPDEFDNLWDSPEHKDIKLQMMKLLLDRNVFTMDPIPERVAEY